MMLDFPTNPTDGDTIVFGDKTFVWAANPGVWRIAAPVGGGGGGASVTVSDTPPVDPADGDLWLNTGDDYGLFVWLDDGDSQQWVQANGGGGVVATQPVEIVEADMTAGWQVWGDVLIQWGTHVMGDTNSTLTFPKAFASVPAVTANVYNDLNGQKWTVHLGARTAATVNFQTLQQDGSATGGGLQVIWCAVGEAPDDLKKPKTVQAIGEAPDAPPDGVLYGRKDEVWTPVSAEFLPLTGGTLTGPLVLDNGWTAFRGIDGSQNHGFYAGPNLDLVMRFGTNGVNVDEIGLGVYGTEHLSLASGSIGLGANQGRSDARLTINGPSRGTQFDAQLLYLRGWSNDFIGIGAWTENNGSAGIWKYWRDGWWEARNWNDSGWVPIRASSFDVNSDRKAKKDVKDAGKAKDKVRKLKVKAFRFKQSSPPGAEPPLELDEVGFIADELVEVMPEVERPAAPATGSDEPMKAYSLPGLVANAVKALQEAYDEIDDLRARLEKLERGA